MRIEVVGDDAVSPQARTYAEYRVFAALTQFAGGQNVRTARVVLRPVNCDDRCNQVMCTVTVLFDKSDSLRVRAIGAHPYAAINRAIERLRTATELEIANGISS